MAYPNISPSGTWALTIFPDGESSVPCSRPRRRLKSPNLAVVAPGIAEALLATAIGLLAAIPALVAYNKLSNDVAKIAARLEGFADEFSAILSRQIDERNARQG